MTSLSAPQSRQQIADALEYQLGDDDLPGVWRLNAQDVRTVIEALRAPAREDVLEEGIRKLFEHLSKSGGARQTAFRDAIHDLRALKGKAAPQDHTKGQDSLRPDGASTAASESLAPAESASLGEIDADCYMPGECGSAPNNAAPAGEANE